tara:strand:- start:4335 stop:4835 length:501 start_codon:yes stop_codon:yes gene_type:complete
MVSGGLSKVDKGIKAYFNSPVEKEKLEYEDKFPEDLPTLEDVKEKYGKVVWCKFTACKNNELVKGLQRTTGTILKNRAYTPLNEQEHIWDGICTKDEIAITYNEITINGGKMKVPSCFSAVTGVSGHIDFTRFLNSDGTPQGGNIDSQHVSDAGYGAMDSSSIYGR